jgi:hypothetical protein
VFSVFDDAGLNSHESLSPEKKLLLGKVLRPSVSNIQKGIDLIIDADLGLFALVHFQSNLFLRDAFGSAVLFSGAFLG